MRIAILGAGAMGSWFGGQLALAGHDVQLLTTNTAHRNAVNESGLRLRSDTGEQTVFLPALHPADIGAPVDLVLLLTKSFQSSAALGQVQHVLTSSTLVLTLQNGLGNAETIAEFLPLEQVFVGVTMLPIGLVEPGLVAAKGEGATHFYAAIAGNTAASEKLYRELSSASIELRLDPSIQVRIWQKVAFNAAMNSLTALSHGTPGNIADAPGAKALAFDIAREVVTVAAALDLVVDLDGVFATINFACAEHRDHKPSMLQDLLRGRRTEVDAINGAVADLGARHSIATPLNATLATLIRLAQVSHQT